MNSPKVIKLPVENGMYKNMIGVNRITAYIHGITIRDTVDEDIVAFDKEQMIQLAKDLLMFWEVPFVNKGNNGQ